MSDYVPLFPDLPDTEAGIEREAVAAIDYMRMLDRARKLLGAGLTRTTSK